MTMQVHMTTLRNQPNNPANSSLTGMLFNDKEWNVCWMQNEVWMSLHGTLGQSVCQRALILSILTHFISKTVKRRPVISMRSGMVRIRIKGKAREALLDFTAHRTPRQTIWIKVNKCILRVGTCTNKEKSLSCWTQLHDWEYPHWTKTELKVTTTMQCNAMQCTQRNKMD